MAYSCECTSDVSLRTVLLRDCPGKRWFVTQGLGHAKRKNARRRPWTLLMLVCAQLGSLLHFFLPLRSAVCEAFVVHIYNAFVKRSRAPQPLIHDRGLNKVKCGCCRQHCFIWLWLICLWTSWQDSIGELFGRALSCVSGYYCASCTFLWWAKFLFNTHIFPGCQAF